MHIVCTVNIFPQIKTFSNMICNIMIVVNFHLNGSLMLAALVLPDRIGIKHTVEKCETGPLASALPACPSFWGWCMCP